MRLSVPLLMAELSPTGAEKGVFAKAIPNESVHVVAAEVCPVAAPGMNELPVLIEDPALVGAVA
jgi:hypothetical protein